MKDSEIRYILHGMFENHELRFSEREALKQLIDTRMAVEYPGVESQRISKNEWHIVIPAKFRVGHEAHFGQVTQQYLEFLKGELMPEWEVPNMIVKYYTTTSALQYALEEMQDGGK